MDRTQIEIAPRLHVPLYTVHTAILGSGAASLNCAEHLYDLGQHDLLILTSKLTGGTSNNSGSDKQTYYKIGLFGDVPDSPMEFARALTAGGMMHGDLAYTEALGSPAEFFHLVKNGVPFPHNRYGAYVGYKTDHDPRQRATSAGPKTSWLMVERSLEQVRRNGTPILDRHEAIQLLYVDEPSGRRVFGLVALDLSRLAAPDRGLVVVNCRNLVMGTGGPGEMYAVSVYPPGQVGSHGMALEIGAIANNLTESQFGLASTRFRWNVSGTYQQVIPRYISVGPEGGEPREFLWDVYPDLPALAGNTFLKGYQWPFHAERLQGAGSSLVDIAVHREIAAGRRVFMDFTENPAGEAFALDRLPEYARSYLERSGAVQETPLERLRHMNPPAVEIYAEHGVDLSEPLEVAVCSQHCNGGLRGSLWWESNIRHLFPIGEVNGSHGVRPGGGALNAGQVGGLRAAQRIAHVYAEPPPSPGAFGEAARRQIAGALSRVERSLKAPASAPKPGVVRREIQARMSEHAAFLRSADSIAGAVDEATSLLRRLRADGQRLSSPEQLATAVQNEHLCLTHLAFLQAINTLIDRGGGSRGAYMVLDPEGERTVSTAEGEMLRHRSENMAMREEIIEVRLAADGSDDFVVGPVPVRPLPEDNSWYETTWRDYDAGGVFTD